MSTADQARDQQARRDQRPKSCCRVWSSPAAWSCASATLPPPAAGQVLVRVEAAGVSFAEQGMRRDRYPGQPKFPFVPGYDLIGVVDRDRPRTWTAPGSAGGWPP